MAVTINRAPWTALVDDSGQNLDGSIWNKAAIKTVLLDEIDTALAKLATSGAVFAAPTVIPYNISNFTANVGTWLVEAGDVLLNQWGRLGPNHIQWTFYLSQTTIANTAPTQLIVQNLPFGPLVVNQVARMGWCLINGTVVDAFMQTMGAATVSILPVVSGGSWPLSTNAGTLAGTFVFQSP